MVRSQLFVPGALGSENERSLTVGVDTVPREIDRRRRMAFFRNQRRISRVLHGIGDLTSKAGAALSAAAVVIIFAIVLAFDGFPLNWETAFCVVASGITLVMLFVIQHTQSRHQLALQLKLDELIRTSPSADDQLVHIEIADDAELDELKKSQEALHESIRDGDDTDDIESYRSTDTS